MLGQDPLTGETIYRPGSGVSQGNGTKENPYRIEGWCILIASGPLVGPAGISLQSTTAHVVIANNTVVGVVESLTDSPVGFFDSKGVVVNTGQNIVIRDNDIFAQRNGIQLSGSQQVEIQNNTLTGTCEFPCSVASNAAISLGGGSNHNTVTGNTISEHGRGVSVWGTDNLIQLNLITGDWSGITIYMPDNLVQNNTVTGSHTGIGAATAMGPSTIQFNTLDENSYGVIISSEQVVRHNSITNSRSDGMIVAWDNGLVYNNTIVASNNHGIRLQGSGHIVENNSIIGNGRDGIHLLGSGHSVLNNTITGNSLGIFASKPATIVGNNIQNNTQGGLRGYFSSMPLVVTDNWWGHESGPSGGIEDNCTGTKALGDGDEIIATQAPICFEPWRTDPNPGAGAND